MSAGSPSLSADDRSPLQPSGFTLVELLVVMAVIAGLLTLVAPAFSTVNTGRQVTLAAYNVEGILDTARAYAKANNTYTWVGFYEEDGAHGSTNPATAGKGRVVVSVVASTDGTGLGSGQLDSTAGGTPLRVAQVNKLVKLDNTHLADANAPATLTRPSVDPAYQVGYQDFAQTTTTKTIFSYPLGAQKPAYTFEKIIRFNPAGDASRVPDDVPVPLLEVGLRPTRGATVDAASKNCAAVQVTGITGAVHIYQP